MKIRKVIYQLILAFMCIGIFNGCAKTTTDKIITNSISFYGMDKLDGKKILFTFRNFRYLVVLNKGKFYYQRNFTVDTLGQIEDILTNNGFERKVNNNRINLSEKDSLKYAAQINSVSYFVLLPLKLTDPATHKEIIDKVTITSKEYYKVKVSFDKNGGGKDFEDVFYYWFDSKDFSMDYFAYASGGKRFRAAESLIESKGVRFQNYTNYEGKKGEKAELENFDVLFEQNKLQKLSEITITNLAVE